MEFHETLVRFYCKWFRDSHDSAVYCRDRGNETKAKKYLKDADKYFQIINENWEIIEKVKSYE